MTIFDNSVEIATIKSESDESRDSSFIDVDFNIQKAYNDLCLEGK